MPKLPTRKLAQRHRASLDPGGQAAHGKGWQIKKSKNQVSAADPRPRFIECRSTQDYENLCARKRAGELSMWRIEAEPEPGMIWRVEVIYSKRYQPDSLF